MTAVLHRSLLWIKPPAGARECLVLDHYARDGERSAIGEQFHRARFQNDADAVRFLAEALAAAIVECAPEWSLLRQAERVVAVASSDGLARDLAAAVEGALGSMTAPRGGGVVVLVADSVQSTEALEDATRAVLDAGATQVLCVAPVVIDHVWD